VENSFDREEIWARIVIGPTRLFAEKGTKLRQKQPSFLEEQEADYHVPMRVRSISG
jgi:hypothetical protein